MTEENREQSTRDAAISLIRMMHRSVQKCEHSIGCAECLELYRLEDKLTKLYGEKP